MTAFKQGDIILIPFPFTDFSTFKQMPAIIISSDVFNHNHNDVLAMAITSQIPEVTIQEDYLLSKQEIQMAQLPKPSLIKVGKIITINKILIRKKLGSLPLSSVEKIKTRLQGIL